MPAAVPETTNKAADHSEQMWKVLKAHIMRERARKKQEREQEVEEERLRKEREAREQQDVMTLGETREQISQLESKLTQLKEEKHQLFLQLKKVLNEDDNRRRQLVKENLEQMISIQTVPANMVHQQLYIQQQQPPPQQRPPLQQQQQPPPQQQTSYKALGKRPRSPSPPPPQVPVSLYGYGYKPAPQQQVGSYQGSPQKDDGRRNELVRAVLWNKTPQYGTSGQPSAFYPVGPAPQDMPIYYTLARESPAAAVAARGPPPQNSHESGPPPPPSSCLPQVDFHLEPTKMAAAEHYAALRGPPTFHSHVIHPGQMQSSIGGQQQPPPKGGSITAGYPVRSQPQYQQQQQPPPPTSSLYTSQTRPLYARNPINFPPRD